MAGAQTSSSETATAVGRDEVVRRSRCAATRARSFQEGGTIGTMNSKRWASGSTGVMLAYANWLGLIGMLPVLAGFLYRIRVEERVLSDELGDPYRSYMGRTKRLVPFVY